MTPERYLESLDADTPAEEILEEDDRSSHPWDEDDEPNWPNENA